MVPKSGGKKIIGVRTFADDVRRVKESQGKAPVEVLKDSEILQQPIPKKVPVPPSKETPVPPKPQNDEKDTGVSFDEPTEIPPFHAINATSIDETTYVDDDLTHIPDKKTLQRETMQTNGATQFAPEKKITIDPKTIDVNEFSEMMPSINEANAVFDSEDALSGVTGGTIIQDKKNSGFNLFAEIGKSFRRWFGNTREDIREARGPKHEILKSSRRKDIIRAAGKDAEHAPVDDHKTVAKRLKNVERINPKNEITLRDAKAAEPTWTHTTTGEQEETGPEPISKNSIPESGFMRESVSRVEEQKLTSLSQTPKSEMRTQIPLSTASNIAKPQQEVAQTKAISEESVHNNKTEEQVVVADPAEVVADPEPATELQPQTQETPTQTNKPQLNRQPVPEERLAQLGQPKPTTETIPPGTPYLTTVAVVIAASVLGIVSAAWWFFRSTPESENVAASNPSIELIENTSSIQIALAEEPSVSLRTIRDAIENNTTGTTLLIRPTQNGVLVDPEIVFSGLSLTLPSNAARSVFALTLGGTTQREPFIIMKFTSFDTVFAGMLAWEPVMLGELAPLFVDESARSITDTRVSNHDVRVIIGTSGNDVLVYGFTDKNTLLITTTRSAYATLAEETR